MSVDGDLWLADEGMRKLAFYLLLLVIFAVPFETVVLLPALGTLTRAFGLMAFGVWALSLLATRKIRKPESFHYSVYVFVLWVVISFFWSADISASYSRIETFVQLLGLVLIVWDLCDSPQTIRASLQAYVLGAAATLAVLLRNFFTGNVAEYYDRFTSLAADPNLMAISFALAVPIAWYLALDSRGRIARWINVAYVPAAAFGIALSGSRAGFIAGVVALLFILASFSRLKPSAVLGSVLTIAAGLVAIFALIPPRTLDRLGSVGNELASGDLGGRLGLWRDGVASFVERPFLGWGTGAIRSATTFGEVSHNIAIEIGVELGIVGLMLLSTVLIFAVRSALSHPRLERRLWMTVLVIWGVAASSLNVDHNKMTWLVLSLVVASSAAGRFADGSALASQREPTGTAAIGLPGPS